MKIFIITGIGVLMLFCAAPAMAGLSFLYRFDTRPPAQIFAMGFTPKGIDANLVNHFLDFSHQDGTSAFIGSTSSFEVALAFAQGLMQGTGIRQGYIYRINADSSFYDVTASMASHLANLEALGYERSLPNYIARLDVAIEGFTWEQEYVTAAPIAGQAISWAIPVTGHDSTHGEIRLTQGDIQANPSAAPSASFAINRLYPAAVPSADLSPCSSPASEDLSSDDEGAVGGVCADDVVAARAGDAYMHVHHLPDCHAHSSRKKRAASIPMQVQCSGVTLRLVNLSRRSRAIAVLSGEQGFGMTPNGKTEL